MEPRADLEVRQGTDGPLVFDPLRHRYFQLGREELATLANGEASNRAAHDELVSAGSEDASRSLADRTRKGRHGWLAFAMHRYLFLRIPLVRPDRFLDVTLPLVRPLMSVGALAIFLLLGVLALALAGRQWGAVETAFLDSLTLDGVIGYAVAVACLKALHELGHAFALKRFGGRVPTIGIAFVVLFPILYTDTTDAWLLSRRRKLLVDGAGIITELGVAVVATWAWLVLPDGAARDIAFALAAVSWILSLAVNLNPFMRFDGYHLLADAIALPNLQERSFALARWRLRALLFDGSDAPPEAVRPGLRRALILYAWTTWAYRLVLFVGIALLVYHATFKLLGIALFCIEIVHFVLRPIWREVREWPAFVTPERPRSLMPMAVTCACVAVMLLPLDRTAHVPAVLEAGKVSILRAPFAGRIEAVGAVNGEVITRGRTVLRIGDPDAALAGRRIEARRAGLAQRSVHSRRAKDGQLAHQAEVALVATARRKWIERRLHGSLVAPSDGRLSIEQGIAVGRHLGAGDPIAILVATGNRVVSLLPEATLRRLPRGAEGTFVPDATGRPIDVHETGRSAFPAVRMDPPELAAKQGGGVRSDGTRPERPHFSIRFEIAEHSLPPGRWRGILVLPVEPRSFARLAYERIAALIVRESGF